MISRKRSGITKLAAVLSLMTLLMCGCSQNSTNYKTIVSKEDDRWIYRIEYNGKTIIRQETIPGVQGVQYFSDREMATKTANLVKHKLIRGQMPTITQEEMGEILNSK